MPSIDKLCYDVYDTIWTFLEFEDLTSFLLSSNDHMLVDINIIKDYMFKYCDRNIIIFNMDECGKITYYSKRNIKNIDNCVKIIDELSKKFNIMHDVFEIYWDIGITLSPYKEDIMIYNEKNNIISHSKKYKEVSWRNIKVKFNEIIEEYFNYSDNVFCSYYNSY